MPALKVCDIRRTLLGLVASLLLSGLTSWTVPALAVASGPANDDLANAEDVGNSSTAYTTGTNLDASKEAAEPNHAGDPGGASVWYRWTAPSGGQFRVDTCDSNFDTLLAVYTGSTLDSFVEVASNDQACGDQSKVSFTAVAGVTYRIAVDGYSAGSTHPPREGSVVVRIAPKAAPTNDSFVNAESLGTATTASTNGDNLDAIKEPGEPQHAGDPGGASVWYSWTALTPGRVRLDSCGSAFDTLLAVYTGATLPTLSQIASNDQGCGNQSRLAFDVFPGTTYWIAVDGWSDSGTQPADEGSLQLNLRPANPPANDNLVNAQSLGNATQASFEATTFDASKESGEPNHGGDPGGASVWYRWTAPSSGPVRLSACGSPVGFDTLIGVYTGSAVNALTSVGGDDDSCAFGLSRAVFQASAGTTYKIAVDGSSHSGASAAEEGVVDVDLKVLSPPANDNFATAQNLGSSETLSITGTNADATTEAGEPYPYIDDFDSEFDEPGGASVWYRWTAPAPGRWFVDLCGSDFDTVLAVYTGSSVGGLTRVHDNDDGCTTTTKQSRLAFDAAGGATYRIVVDGSTYGFFHPPEEGSIQLELYPAPPSNQLPVPPSQQSPTPNGGAPGATPQTKRKCKKGTRKVKVHGKVACKKLKN